MSIQIIWSLENGGTNIDSFLDHGSNASSNITDPVTLYIRHTGNNSITNCSIYMRPWAGSTEDGQDYSADASPIDDYNEIIGWGDPTASGLFGGWQVNMDAANDFPTTSWPDALNKTAISGLGFVASSGIAKDSGTAFELKKEMSGTTIGVVDGEVPAGVAPNWRFKTRIQIPASGVSAGIRQFEHVLSFTFTS